MENPVGNIVILKKIKHLGFIYIPRVGGRVYDPVRISREGTADVLLILLLFFRCETDAPAAGTCLRRQSQFFPLLILSEYGRYKFAVH